MQKSHCYLAGITCPDPQRADQTKEEKAKGDNEVGATCTSTTRLYWFEHLKETIKIREKKRERFKSENKRALGF